MKKKTVHTFTCMSLDRDIVDDIQVDHHEARTAVTIAKDTFKALHDYDGLVLVRHATGEAVL